MKEMSYIDIINKKYGTEFKNAKQYAKFVRQKYSKSNKKGIKHICNPVPNFSSFSDDYIDSRVNYNNHCY